MNEITSFYRPTQLRPARFYDALFRVAVLVAALTLLLLPGCKFGDRELTSRQDALLAATSAESPYLFASLEPFPADFKTLFREKLLPAMTAYLSDTAALNPGLAGPGWRMFLEVSAALNDPARAKAAGLNDEPLWALYGAPMLPVMRFEISDAERAEAWILAEFQKAGIEPEVVKSGGEAVHKISFDGAAVYFRMTGQHAVFAFFPNQDDHPNLKLALAITPPSAPLDSAALRAKAEKDGLPLYEIGYLLPPELGRLIFAADGPFAAEIAADPELQTLSTAPCSDEFNALIGLVPRFDFALKSADARQITMVSEWAMRPDLAADLVKMSGGVPDFASDGGAPFEASVSLRLGVLRDSVLRLARDTLAEPWTCPLFAALNSTAEKILAAANTPIPPAAGNLRGISLVLDRLPSDPAAVTDFEGYLGIHIDNPTLLIGMVQMFMPALAQVSLTADSKPVEVPAMLTGIDNPPLFAAMSDHAIGLARGEAALAALPARLGPPPANGRTLAGYRFDYRWLDGLLEKSMSDYVARGGLNSAADCAPDCPGDETADPTPEKTLADLRRLLDLFERQYFVFKATERGMTTEQGVIFANQ